MAYSSYFIKNGGIIMKNNKLICPIKRINNSKIDLKLNVDNNDYINVDIEMDIKPFINTFKNFVKRGKEK